VTKPDFPFLTAYDPPGTSEGPLDPVGLYQIADQLAVRLVPGVRERMQRIRFLTAIAVGTRVLEDIKATTLSTDSAPFLAWEWLVIESFVRAAGTDGVAAGVAGVQVVRRAVDKYGYVDAASYLKTPRVFGFHGVYKRLAVHLGIIDIHLQPREGAERLIAAWAADYPHGGETAALQLIERWARAVKRCVGATAQRTMPQFAKADWDALAEAFDPDDIRVREKHVLKQMLLQTGERALGALPSMWNLIRLADEDALDAQLLDTLRNSVPEYRALLSAIQEYELFARSLQDAFDVMRLVASESGTISVDELSSNEPFKKIVTALPSQFASTERALTDIGSDLAAQAALFTSRFSKFGERLAPQAFARTLVDHHVHIQQQKSAGGKRSWFDRLDDSRFFLRTMYHLKDWKPAPGTYLHDYRAAPIIRFRKDLA